MKHGRATYMMMARITKETDTPNHVFIVLIVFLKFISLNYTGRCT